MTTYSDPENNSTETAPENSDRRLVLKKLAVGTAALAGCSVIPNKWTSPLVEFGALPAHAVTSGAPTAQAPVSAPTPAAAPTAAPTAAPPAAPPAAPIAPPPAAPEPTQTSRTEQGKYHGRHNGNRPTWYLSKKMSSYPAKFMVTIDGCGTTKVTSNNGRRFTSGGVVVKQSDVPGRGMAIVGSANCGSRTCKISY